MANLLLLLLSITTVQSLTLPSDIAALKAFVSSVKNIPPTSCLDSWHFATSDPCATPRTNFTCGVQCDTASTPYRVTGIALERAGYSGTLSPLVSSLSALTILDLTDNAFYGPIPTSISNLKSLQILALVLNSFSGGIPPAIFSIKTLETVDLSYNSLSGAVPDCNLSPSLRRLDVSFNKITGGVPKLGSNLIELALKGNHLTGSLLHSSFAAATQLEVVELSQNAISGTVEYWFFQMQSIQQVDLANNTLTHVNIWKAVSGSSLVAIDLGYNLMEGTFPANLSTYPTLSSLSLRYNRLRGPIPMGLGKKGSSLRRLFLDGNFFDGEPPQQLFYGTTAVSGSLGDNCLAKCPTTSELCTTGQKPARVCRQA